MNYAETRFKKANRLSVDLMFICCALTCSGFTRIGQTFAFLMHSFCCYSNYSAERAALFQTNRRTGGMISARVIKGRDKAFKSGSLFLLGHALIGAQYKYKRLSHSQKPESFKKIASMWQITEKLNVAVFSSPSCRFKCTREVIMQDNGS